MRTDEQGTLVAFTFQAVANGNLMAKLKNVVGWGDILKTYAEMKTWTTGAISAYYRDEIQSILSECKPACVSFDPVVIETISSADTDIVGPGLLHGNSIVYGGKRRNDSTMMFTLYRARHNPGCVEEHRFTPSSPNACRASGKGKRKASDVEAEEVIDLERQCFDDRSDSELVPDPETAEQPLADKPDDSDGDDHYVVDRIIAQKTRNGKTYFRVTWKGFDDVTWEPEEHLADCIALDRWEEDRILNKTPVETLPSVTDAAFDVTTASSFAGSVHCECPPPR
jgi:hypothetical protein